MPLVTHTYTQVGSELEVKRQDSDAVVWRGRPDAAAVLSVLPVDDDAIVLLEIEKRGESRNLARVAADGSVLWRAQGPEASDGWTDQFVRAFVRSGRLYANSWSGYLVEIDPETGDEIRREFTK